MLNGKLSFAIKSVVSGVRNVAADPVLTVCSTEGKFSLTPAATKFMGIATGENVQFFNNIDAIEVAIDAKDETLLAECEEAGIDVEKKPEISIDDFMKVQLRVGEILKCEEVPKSKKLLCSQVKINSEVKQIVSGIKQHYSAEEMVGKKVMVLVNLKPATLAGVVSEGMLLCAEDADGNLALMTPEKKMPAGAEIC